MLKIRAIEESNREKWIYFIHFLVKKESGKFRPVINLKKLNEFVEYNHFKMETLQHFPKLMKREIFPTSINLENAYLLIPIHKKSKKFLKFISKNKLWIYMFAIWVIKCPQKFYKDYETIFFPIWEVWKLVVLIILMIHWIRIFKFKWL